MPGNKLKLSIVAVLFFFLFFPSFTRAQSPSQLDCSGGFAQLFPGSTSPNAILYKKVTLTSAREITAHIVRVNLSDPHIDIATTPRDLVLHGMTVSQALNAAGGAIAINGSGFYVTNGTNGPEYDPQGLNASQGDVYSEGDGGFVFTSDENNYSAIGPAPTDRWDILSGFNVLIQNGNIYDKILTCSSGCGGDCDGVYCTFTSRTSIGMTSSQTLIIIVTEGSTQLIDLANMMDRCGAENAVNQDGGGSSTLAASLPNSENTSRFFPIPPTLERIVANHLVICFEECTFPASPGPVVPLPTGDAKPAYRGLTGTPPFPFPCNESAPQPLVVGADEEFHSLRPYQASPCNPNKEDLALFCGNDLYVGDYETVIKLPTPFPEAYTRNGNPIFPNPPITNPSPLLCYYCSSEQSGVCLQNPNTPCIYNPETCTPGSNDPKCGFCDISSDARRETCAFTVNGSKDVVVDVAGAEFPIMGYTEPSRGNTSEQYTVINSENTQEETVSHATKMNEYVSWYLNGVTGRAEYPYLDPKLDCVGESTGKVGSCKETRVAPNGGLECLGTWGIPFVEPFLQLTLMADGKSVCTGEKNFCCVNSILPSHSEDTPGSGYIVNYSGPIKKLLPFSLQNIERIKEINDATASAWNDAGIRHDQVVGCETSSVLNFMFRILNLEGVNITRGAPIKCYGGVFLGIPSHFWNNLTKFRDRLSSFFNHLPPIEDEIPWLGGDFNNWLMNYKHWRGNTCLSLPIHLNIGGFGGVEFHLNLCFDNPAFPNIFGNIFSYIPLSSTEDRLGDVRVRSAGFSFQWSPYMRIIWSKVSDPADPNSPPKPADMFFPHMEEDTQLADLLQNTFAYKDAVKDAMPNSGFVPDSPYCEYVQVRTNPGDDLFAGEISARIEYTAEMSCVFLNWGGQDTSEGVTPLGNLCENQLMGVCKMNYRYLWTETSYGQYDCGVGEVCVVGEWAEMPSGDPMDFNCLAFNNPLTFCRPRNFVPAQGGACNEINNYDCPDPTHFACSFTSDNCVRNDQPPPPQYCTYPVVANMKLETRTPLANEAWARLVAGATGIFRKMLPKMGEGNTFEGIYDMPGSTRVTYINNSGGPLYVGNPANQRGGSGAQLYFPHIGGIKEYFLTGIQAMLRPKGTANQPVFCEGDDCVQATTGNPITGVCDGTSFEALGALPDMSSTGRTSVSEALGNLTPELMQVYRDAEEQTGVPCEVLAGIHFIEANSSPNQDLQQGAPLNGRSLLESAIQAGYELLDKVGGNIDNIDTLIAALSLYNGGGNSNCRSHDNCAPDTGHVYCSDFNTCDAGNNPSVNCICSSRFRDGNPDPDLNSCRMNECSSPLYHFDFNYTGNCSGPPGYDDPYAVNYLADQDMYLFYQYDCTQTPPFVFQRPGSFTFALGLYLSERGQL